jgi:(E)-4-hydroxy-3-methyl-but-2-enyl pyrophosphate reductase
MLIRRLKTQGFCFGVAITVKKAEEAVATRDDVTTLGHIVHNPQMVAKLEAAGLKNASSIDDVDSGMLFVRAHGLPVEVFEEAKRKGLEVIDATCPMVTKIHRQAEKLRDEGYKIIIVGDPQHPEVRGTLSHVPGAWCIETVEEVAALPRASRIGVVVQSTYSGSRFGDIVRELVGRYYEVRTINTICTDTHNRQAEVQNVAKDVDIMVVIGGKTSANTKHLAELAEMNGAKAYHIEKPEDLVRDWFNGSETVAIASGASTPGFLVDQAVEQLERWFPAAA